MEVGEKDGGEGVKWGAIANSRSDVNASTLKVTLS